MLFLSGFLLAGSSSTPKMFELLSIPWDWYCDFIQPKLQGWFEQSIWTLINNINDSVNIFSCCYFHPGSRALSSSNVEPATKITNKVLNLIWFVIFATLKHSKWGPYVLYCLDKSTTSDFCSFQKAADILIPNDLINPISRRLFKNTWVMCFLTFHVFLDNIWSFLGHKCLCQILSGSLPMLRCI